MANEVLAAVVLCCILPVLVNGAEEICNPGPRSKVLGKLSLKIPKDRLAENVIICGKNSKELATWSHPNKTTAGPDFNGGFCWNRTEEDKQGVTVQFEFPVPTDGGPRPPYNCYSGACSGGAIQCNATYSTKVPGGCQGQHARALNILAAVVLAWLLM